MQINHGQWSRTALFPQYGINEIIDKCKSSKQNPLRQPIYRRFTPLFFNLNPDQPPPMIPACLSQQHGTAEAVQDGVSLAGAGQDDLFHHFQRLLTGMFVLGGLDGGKIPDVGEGPAGCGFERAA